MQRRVKAKKRVGTEHSEEDEDEAVAVAVLFSAMPLFPLLRKWPTGLVTFAVGN